MDNYLDYLAEIGQSYIHARGKIATYKIVELLDCKPDERVLEIGYGTGATLCWLAAAYPETKFFGLEASKTMFEAAMKRAKFCGLSKRIDLTLATKPGQLPFQDDTFHSVYVESVLGIQEGQSLPALLKEVKRVLKPNGSLIFNETIWLDTTELSLIKEINDSCKEQFGIILSNGEFPYLSDWTALLEQIGFDVTKTISVGQLEPEKSSTYRSVSAYLSLIYSLRGKWKLFYKRSLIRKRNHYNEEMKKLHKPNAPIMEGTIIRSHVSKE